VNRSICGVYPEESEQLLATFSTGDNYLKHMGEHLVTDMKAAGGFQVTNDFSRLSKAEAILVCVPTPL
jgi:UDP-N-acetyl-D-mannosaminuronate dehydrogenase